MGNASFDRRVDRPVGSYVESVRAKAPAFLRPEVDHSPSGLIKNISVK